MIYEGSLNGPTLVIGCTDWIDRRIAAELRDRGVSVRQGSRSAQPRFDWNDQATWTSVLEGVDAICLSESRCGAGARAADTFRVFTMRAAFQGVRRIVVVADRDARHAVPYEELLQNTGIAWTVLRTELSTQESVDSSDLVGTAVTALTEDGHAGRVYELTTAAAPALTARATPPVIVEMA